MNNEIINDLYNEKYDEFINDFIKRKVKENPSLIKKYEILQVEFNLDGDKKDIYMLAAERDIKKIQIESDKNEIDYKASQGEITKEEYNNSINNLNEKLENQNLLYDDLIFDIINKNSLDEIQCSIEKYNLNNIDLRRLAAAISAVAQNKINQFRINNNNFMIDRVSYWNYKYNKISKGLSKAREVESFIFNIIDNNI